MGLERDSEKASFPFFQVGFHPGCEFLNQGGASGVGLGWVEEP
jgi:hypothetical protein